MHNRHENQHSKENLARGIRRLRVSEAERREWEGVQSLLNTLCTVMQRCLMVVRGFPLYRSSSPGPHLGHQVRERRQADRQTGMQTERQTDRHTDEQTERKTDRYAYNLADRQACTRSIRKTEFMAAGEACAAMF